MLKTEELNKIKKLCFDKIYRESNDKQQMGVSIEPIGADVVSVIMSNGIDYARLIVKLNKMCALQPIQVSWQDFCKICELFGDSIEYQTNGNTIIFKEEKTKTKLTCQQYGTDTNKHCNFKFNFNDSQLQLVDMSNCCLLKKQKGSVFDSICLWQNYIMSTDGSFGIINKTQNNFGEQAQLLIEKLPQGKWFYSPTQRLVISEDKSIAMTIKRSNNSFPNKALLQISQTPLRYNMKANVKELNNILNKCSMMGEFIVLTSMGEQTMNASCFEYETELVAQNNAPNGFSIKLGINYIKYALSCCEDKDVKILFSDNKELPMIRIELNNTIVFGMGIK